MTLSASLRVKGFSLVEMMVALGLVAIMSGIGLASTLRSNEQKKITESAEMARQFFMQAKSMAQAGKKDCAICGATGGVCGRGDTPLAGWRTIITSASPVTLVVRGECGASTFFSSTKTFPNRIILNATRNVLFLPLNKGTNLNNPVTITINSTMNLLTSKTFTISPQGEISAIY